VLFVILIIRLPLAEWDFVTDVQIRHFSLYKVGFVGGFSVFTVTSSSSIVVVSLLVPVSLEFLSEEAAIVTYSLAFLAAALHEVA
jgi:hypothetical protein